MREEIKKMSVEQLASLGIENTVYIKPVVENGVTAFAVHNAAGATVGVLPTETAAQATVLAHDLKQATLH
jgi:hypothetical protein